MDANGVRRAFLDFFVERGHRELPSAGLIPHHPRAPLFTNAGMNQFIPYFLGEERPPFSRATTAQKCVRVRGKHDDIEVVGRTTRHFTFFEMLGNFSFGDYFKAQAIPWAWELLTERLNLDPDRLWATVYTEDDEAAEIWRDAIGLPSERIVRMGEDNFWEMGETGPCGPSSELFYDRGASYGPAGGPLRGGEERYVEVWNLVFPQYDRQADGTLADLPRPGIDTGLGMERLLAILEDVPSIWETDVLRPIIARAEALTGRRYGADGEVDVALRILADHARSMTFLVSDGVFPSNEDRGYVLRRLVRRAVRQAFQLGVEQLVTPGLVDEVVAVMGEGYPELVRNREFVSGVVSREEEQFRATLRSGLRLLDDALAANREVPGEVAFRLHDTHGFPIELTREIANERGVSVDEDGFRTAMQEQRQRARQATRGDTGEGAHAGEYRQLLDQFGTTRFVGYEREDSESRVVGVVPADDGRQEIFLDQTPFYAEGGGQVGDTGTITTDGGRARVVDTTYALPGLIRHLATVEDGEIRAGQHGRAEIDGERRAAIRRNHTGTHLIHWALREVLGDHVKQQGSLVAPDRLRFDFTHYAPLTAEERTAIEDLVNGRILADEPVEVLLMSRAEAERSGAIAFFEEKYGDEVRVIRAGSRSAEFCGGTHVERLGMIGPLEIVSEGSIGSNIRRLEATTGMVTIDHLRGVETTLANAAGLLKTSPEELPAAIERKLADLRAAETRVRAAEQAAMGDVARSLAGAAADGGAVVARRDGLGPDQLRELAQQVKQQPGVETVVLGGSPGEGKVSLVAVVGAEGGIDAPALIGPAARIVGGGGGGKKRELAQAGGRDVTRLDDALNQVRTTLELPTS